MSDRTTAPPEIMDPLRARLKAAKANGIKAVDIAKKASIHKNNVGTIRDGQRSISTAMAQQIITALDALIPTNGQTAPAIPVPAKARKPRHDGITRAEADALRERVRELIAQSSGRPYQIARRLGVTAGTWRQWFREGRGMLPATAAKVWKGLGIERPAEFAEQAPAPKPSPKPKPSKPKPYARGHETPKLDRALMKKIAELARDTVVRRQLCTMDDLRQASHNMTHQGLTTFWSPEGRNIISPERAAAMLRFLAGLRVRGAKDLLIDVMATGAVGTSTATAAPGTVPRAAPGMTVKVRELMRAALSERFGGQIPALAKAIGVTAAKTTKILGGFSNLSARDAERIAAALDRLPASTQLMLPNIQTLAEHPDDPIAASRAPLAPSAVSAEAARMLARWKDEAFQFFINMASARTTQE